MKTIDVGQDWTLVESDAASSVTIVPHSTVWLAYHAAKERPRLHLLSIKLPGRTRSTFVPRTAGEGLWIRTETDSPVRVELLRTARRAEASTILGR